MRNVIGPEGRKDRFSKYEGKWIAIYQRGMQASFRGYCKEVDEGYALLNPHEGNGLDSEGNLVHILVNEDSDVLLSDSTIEVTTREVIQAMCDRTNKKNDKKTEE